MPADMPLRRWLLRAGTLWAIAVATVAVVLAGCAVALAASFALTFWTPWPFEAFTDRDVLRSWVALSLFGGTAWMGRSDSLELWWPRREG